jgi:hypothetical protein
MIKSAQQWMAGTRRHNLGYAVEYAAWAPLGSAL